MYRLQFLNPSAPREPVVISQSAVTIGRDSSCDVQLADNGVADRHARIERRRDGYYFCNLDEANGSSVNGQHVRDRRLAGGDELEIGGARLRFEMIHGVAGASSHRPLDLLEIAAATIVVLVIGGQVALLSLIFTGSHPMQKISSPKGSRGDQPTVRSAASPTSSAAADSAGQSLTRSASTSTPSIAATPKVLNRMIRLVRVDRRDSGAVATVTIQAKAQVGERELDTRSVAMSVQFATTGATTQNLVWQEPILLPMPAWENFKTKVFTVRYPGRASDLAGFVVRAYYHDQLQDLAVVPPSLQAPALSTDPGGGS